MSYNIHQFHIPVLGVGFSVDAPLKVAQYGISSVVSLIDDMLMEMLREKYTLERGKKFIPIPLDSDDVRAHRITAYLNMLNEMVKERFEKLRNSPFEIGSEITKYFEMLPSASLLKTKYDELVCEKDPNKIKELQTWLREKIEPGSIDVNIMSKVDKANSDSKGNILSAEFNDAHSALRGYAMSDLESSLVFSAGMNPRLFSYLESFKDFYPNELCKFKKKITIKVSDFRSALIHGKFLAKKGLWVSEYRVESGLNCGGHAFASDGYLLGPIMDEFNNRKEELLNSVKEIYYAALDRKEIKIAGTEPNYILTVQGGLGTFSEHQFMFRKYGVSSTGWGSPFLLVPEVMNVDEDTLQKLSAAGEDDLYLSNVSPLGVPFNNLRGNERDAEKMFRVTAGKPGSPCTKKFLLSNKEFSDKPLCTASISYINKKLTAINSNGFDKNELHEQIDATVEKTCLCEGLISSALRVNNLLTPKQSQAVAVCPGPNLAYFSRITGLREMVDHIYGRINLITSENRPNVFIKEISLYINYLANKIDESIKPIS
ncbi:MAG: hypothetical protein K8H86_01470, partial [Ignavibacteriaceae bacterium]|nr:hypothetical protein [Ignavibacteriaceae bacterium]